MDNSMRAVEEFGWRLWLWIGLVLSLVLLGCLAYHISHDGRGVRGGPEQLAEIVVYDAETKEEIVRIPIEHERGEPIEEVAIFLRKGSYFAVAVDKVGLVSEPSEVSE